MKNEDLLHLFDYYDNQFENDLKKLTTSKFHSNSYYILNNFRIDKNTVFWGGENWNNIEKDLLNIKKEYREAFILCLFGITIIDMGLFAQSGGIHSNTYVKFRNVITYPKFGRSGLSPSFESPKKIVTVPEKLSIEDFEQIKKCPQNFAILFERMCEKNFEPIPDLITARIFITNLIDDEDFIVNEEDKGTIFEVLYDAISGLLKN